MAFFFYPNKKAEKFCCSLPEFFISFHQKCLKILQVADRKLKAAFFFFFFNLNTIIKHRKGQGNYKETTNKENITLIIKTGVQLLYNFIVGSVPTDFVLDSMSIHLI